MAQKLYGGKSKISSFRLFLILHFVKLLLNLQTDPLTLLKNLRAPWSTFTVSCFIKARYVVHVSKGSDAKKVSYSLSVVFVRFWNLLFATSYIQSRNSTHPIRRRRIRQNHRVVTSAPHHCLRLLISRISAEGGPEQLLLERSFLVWITGNPMPPRLRPTSIALSPTTSESSGSIISRNVFLFLPNLIGQFDLCSGNSRAYSWWRLTAGFNIFVSLF